MHIRVIRNNLALVLVVLSLGTVTRSGVANAGGSWSQQQRVLCAKIILEVVGGVALGSIPSLFRYCRRPSRQPKDEKARTNSGDESPKISRERKKTSDTSKTQKIRGGKKNQQRKDLFQRQIFGTRSTTHLHDAVVRAMRGMVVVGSGEDESRD
jgi:hypothetical protein